MKKEFTIRIYSSYTFEWITVAMLPIRPSDKLAEQLADDYCKENLDGYIALTVCENGKTIKRINF